MGNSHGLIVYLFLFLISFAFAEVIPIALLPCLCKFESVLNTDYPLECHTSLFLCLLNMCIHISYRHLHPVCLQLSLLSSPTLILHQFLLSLLIAPPSCSYSSQKLKLHAVLSFPLFTTFKQWPSFIDSSLQIQIYLSTSTSTIF